MPCLSARGKSLFLLCLKEIWVWGDVFCSSFHPGLQHHFNSLVWFRILCYYFAFLSRRLLSCSENIRSITGAKALVSKCRGKDWNCWRFVFVGVGSKMIREGRQKNPVSPKEAQMCNLQLRTRKRGVCDSYTIFHTLHCGNFLQLPLLPIQWLLLFRHFCTENMELGRLAKRC